MIFFKKNLRKWNIWQKSKKFVKKLLTLQFENVILYEQLRKIAANDLWKLSKIMSFVDRIKNEINSLTIKRIFYWEFDPGSGLTLAACLRHASRTKCPIEIWMKLESLLKDGMTKDLDSALSGERVSNTWVICLQAGDNS